MPLEEFEYPFEYLIEVHHRPSDNSSNEPWHLSICSVKSFREPPVDWYKEVLGFLAFALLLPESSHAGGSS